MELPVPLLERTMQDFAPPYDPFVGHYPAGRARTSIREYSAIT